MMNTAYILLGSNINKEENLPTAVRLLVQLCDVQAYSSVYETVPVGLLNQPNFFNAIVVIQTPLTADELKENILTKVEQQLKRVRQADKNAPRTIDADIVLFNDDVFDYDGRHIPDPDLLKFPHAAVPVAELIPTQRHPETGEPFELIANRLFQQATEKNEQAIPIWKRPDISLVID
jgi:2-amino-4-hydroxy-6-hydroxymethyldihydropteridine diphosphokinase